MFSNQFFTILRDIYDEMVIRGSLYSKQFLFFFCRNKDAYLLTVCQEACKSVDPEDISMETYRQIADHLKDKTPEQVSHIAT